MGNNNIYAAIREWAIARNLIDGCTAKDQALKLSSEFGEFALAFMGKCGQDEDKRYIDMKDGIGDSIVVLTIIAAQIGVNIETISPNPPSDFKYLAATYKVIGTQVAIGNLSDSLLKNNLIDARVQIRTVLDCLQRLENEFGFARYECVMAAYEEIKDRMGVMYNGTFIKSTDENYARAMAEIEALDQQRAANPD